MARSDGLAPCRPFSAAGPWQTPCAVAFVLACATWIVPAVWPEAVAAPQAKGGRPARARTEYHQVEVVYTRMAEAMNEWEAKGWETFQVVPIQAANPGVGGTMRVAIALRRPER
jgi:hypothetical protein